MALSVNNKYLALFADTGLVWIGSSDLGVSLLLQLCDFLWALRHRHLLAAVNMPLIM